MNDMFYCPFVIMDWAFCYMLCHMWGIYQAFRTNKRSEQYRTRNGPIIWFGLKNKNKGMILFEGPVIEHSLHFHHLVIYIYLLKL